MDGNPQTGPTLIRENKTSASAVTIKALLRGRHYTTACARTDRRVQRGWQDTDGFSSLVVETPDEWLAAKLGLQIVTQRRWRSKSGRRIEVEENLLVVPPWLTKVPGRAPCQRSPLFEAISLSIDFVGKFANPSGPVNWRPAVEHDSVIEIQLKGRRVFVHSFRSRLLQAMLLDLIARRADEAMLDGVYAYRPERSRFTALHAARFWVRRGYCWALEVDVQKFFDGLMIDAVEWALRHELPWMRKRLRDFVLSFLVVNVLRRPSHPGRRAGAVGRISPPGFHVLPGAPMAPLLSNIVASHFLDKPFNAAFGETAILLRYSDNVLLLAREPQVLDEALQVLTALLGVLHLELHPPGQPVDLRRGRLPWLGKVLHGGTVLTSRDHMVPMVAGLLALDPVEPEFRSAAFQLLDELVLDPLSAKAQARRLVGRESRLHAACLDQVEAEWRRRRAKEPPPDPEPLDFTDAEEGGEKGGAD